MLVRIKPSSEESCLDVHPHSLVLREPDVPQHHSNPRTPRALRRMRFTFDAVLGPESTQSDVYDLARPLIDAVLTGGSGCIFSYGQSGSGKTHTMLGTQEQPGIVPRAVAQLWAQLASDEQASVALTYVELYNDTFRDLLGSCNHKNRLLPAQEEEARKAQHAITLREIRGCAATPASIAHSHPI